MASMLTPPIPERKCFKLFAGTGQVICWDGSSDLLGPRASRPQMSAKRENVLGSTSEKLRACGAFAGGMPAVPANHLLPQKPFGICSRLTVYFFRITRLSPARTVIRSRSKYSSKGMAYLRETPARSLKPGTSIRRSGSCALANSRNKAFRCSIA